MSIINGHPDAAKLLVESGASVIVSTHGLTEGIFGTSTRFVRPLNFALHKMAERPDRVVMRKWIELLRMLLDRGAPVWPNAPSGTSALGQSTHPHVPYRVTTMLAAHRGRP
ncbi:hypothetical protein PG994_013433 [Apiospora phragmitis]|uniref:Uncharacterized protein n=1 Tax=Apiospora phragmitis TaxID=2905665 RepID=A0ABR1TAE7_9PEZI